MGSMQKSAKIVLAKIEPSNDPSQTAEISVYCCFYVTFKQNARWRVLSFYLKFTLHYLTEIV